MLQTNRLLLRQLKASDLEAMETLLGNAEVMEFSDQGTLNSKAVQSWLTGQIENYNRDDGTGFLAIEVIPGSEAIGYCGLTRFANIEGISEVEIGYRLNREFWGHGYATEAALAVRDHAFSTLNLTRLVALIEPRNKRSIRVAGKLGMTYEKAVMIEGYVYPDHLYSIRRP